MGRVLSGSTAGAGVFGGASGAAALARIGGLLPLYGTGEVRVFFAGDGPLTFVPKAVRHRIRVFGGGASSLADGQSSSFASLISATGGKAPAGLAGGLGGQGIGGDFQANGGRGGAGLNLGSGRYAGGGGGAAGSQLGAGGDGGDADPYNSGAIVGAGGGGGAIGGNRGGNGSATLGRGGGYGASVYSRATPDLPGLNLHGEAGALPSTGLAIPMLQFVGGGAGASIYTAGSGAGGHGANRTVNGGRSWTGGDAGWGGGGGGTASSTASTPQMRGGRGRYGGGMGGGVPAGAGGGGGGGFAMGEFDLTVGQSYVVTLAQAVLSETDVETSSGIVIVEW